MKSPPLPAALACVLLLAACGSLQQPGGTSDEILVFAAASLTEAFDEIGQEFEQRHPDLEVLFSFASSSSLGAQLLEGVSPDVYASADLRQMEAVRRAGLVHEPKIFARNRICIITPADNPARIDSAADLAGRGLRLVLAAPEVPAGHYARALLKRAGLLEEIERNVVSYEDDVKGVVGKVRLGEADAGVVYVTDVTQDLRDEVRAIPLPATAPLATYPIAILKEAPHAREARRFVSFVLSETGQAILREHGFRPR